MVSQTDLKDKKKKKGVAEKWLQEFMDLYSSISFPLGITSSKVHGLGLRDLAILRKRYPEDALSRGSVIMAIWFSLLVTSPIISKSFFMV